MTEHGISKDKPVIGVSFDGTGYGEDGAIWGGEFLIANYRGYQRVAHLKYTPLPGGDKSIKEPWRIALAWLFQLDIEWDDNLHPIIFTNSQQPIVKQSLEILHRQLKSGINTPKTSSIGRLFDAISSLVGLRHMINYEAQAAIELESVADSVEESSYSFKIDAFKYPENDCLELNPEPVFHGILNDLRKSEPTSIISARFHNGLANAVYQTCKKIRDQYNVNEVILSGGVWQNITLLMKTMKKLDKSNFNVFIHNQVPTNDGGLALGQAAIAYHNLINGDPM
jgi:hydrogenase maturation protein HypF